MIVEVSKKKAEKVYIWTFCYLFFVNLSVVRQNVN